MEFDRFVTAQDAVWPAVEAELRAGRKRSHWMWFVFPQLAGLGRSATADHYALRSLAEARAYLGHPVLGPRLVACTCLVLTHAGSSLDAIFGFPDALKFRSSMTLFHRAAPDNAAFAEALAVFCGGKPDPETQRLLEERA